MVLLELLPILMITLVYGLIYLLIHRRNPDAFRFKDSLVDPFYFSFTTMSSVGYGDYRPQKCFNREQKKKSRYKYRWIESFRVCI